MKALPELPIGARVKLLGRDVTEMVVDALWLSGFTIASIAKTLDMTRSQVGGIIARGPYPQRGALTIDERQTALDLLKDEDALRRLLPRFSWRVVRP
ncbi:MAG: hypothetical protein KDE63_09385 [Novosphingobium sp.]|nr:hypothetical protein [Novosphingobium sp.]